MFYNLELFGKRFKDIRKALGLSQKDVAEITTIDDKTIRRIENGKVLPKLDTLEILSSTYKEDLASLLIEYRIDDYSIYHEISNKIEFKLDNGEQHTLHTEFRELIMLLSLTTNPYYKKLINQLILFTDAAIIYEKDNNNNNIVLNKLIQAMKITTPAFDLQDYVSYVYSSMEIRILMNMAFALNRLNDKEKYMEIMEFCANSVDSDNDIYPKLCHNLASAYIRGKNYQTALEFSNLGIKSCQENRNFNGLNILYYGKGVAEYRLGHEEYIDSFKTSIYLCRAFGQTQLEKTIIKNCNKYYDSIL